MRILQFPATIFKPIFFLLLCRPVAAIIIGDVLREIVCRPMKPTLLHSLQFGRHFLHPQSSLPDGNVYTEVHFIEKYIPGLGFTFRVTNNFKTILLHTLVRTYIAFLLALMPTSQSTPNFILLVCN